MIVGGGMLATAFAAYANDEQHIIFAAGVSDSKATDPAVFQREKNLLQSVMRANPDKRLVYFSTCSLYDSTLHNSPYIHHKSAMEHLIRRHPAFVIFRLPQVVGATKSPTLIHFLYQKILSEQSFELWTNSKRNLIDVADVAKAINVILTQGLFTNQIVNVASPISTGIYEIVMILEQIIEKRAIYRIADRGSFYHIDLSQVQRIYEHLGIHFDGDYANRVIRKYYAAG